MLYLDLEDLKQSQSDGGWGGGGINKWRDRKSYSHRKEPAGCVSPPHPGAKSDFWPTMPSREQRGYPKSDPGGDHCYVGCLGQTRVSLPE